MYFSYTKYVESVFLECTEIQHVSVEFQMCISSTCFSLVSSLYVTD